jgi:hypothetical protein
MATSVLAAGGVDGKHENNAHPFEQLTGDVLREVFRYLLPSEASQLRRVCKKTKDQLDRAWADVLSWADAGVVANLLDLRIGGQRGCRGRRVPTPTDMREVARLVEGVSDLSTVSWQLVDFERRKERIPAMEAHAAYTVLGRYVAVVGGWGANDGNDVYVMDCKGLGTRPAGAPATFSQPPAVLRRVQGRTFNKVRRGGR